MVERDRRTGCALVLLACAWLLPAGSVRAYSYASPLGKGCHEGLSLSALQVLRRDLAQARAVPAGDDDRAWIQDLPLDLPYDARDLATASLLVGVRDNDLKGHHGLDNAELALVHGDPEKQHEHCLRGPDDDEPDGSRRALRACREYVRDRTRDAFEHGLDPRGAPDPQQRLRVRVHLALAGTREVPAMRAWLQLGRAAHALQDSFAHAVRSPDALRVRSVLNWVDFAHERLVEERDGPAHRRALDECVAHDPVLLLRRQRAAEATHALLRAALTPERDRLAATDAVLDRYLGFEPGCNADNGFCDAPELAYPPDSLGCAIRAPGRTHARSAWAALLLLAALLTARRRRQRQRTRTTAVPACAAARFALVLAWLAWLAGERAHAQRAPSPPVHEQPVAGTPSPSLQAIVVPSVPAATPARSPFALQASAGAAIDEAALATAVGARYRASERWHFGLDVEWNPWASLEAQRVRPGSLNVYASAIWRPFVSADLALRVAGNAGASLLLFDLYGAPAGSVGPYLGLSLLGLELALSDHATLVFEPADVRVPIPHLGAIPMTHRQYRATIGLQWWL